MKKSILLLSIILHVNICFSLHITIVESQSANSGHTMDSHWLSVATGMGHTAQIEPQTILDNTTFFATTDILIVSSGVIALSPLRVSTILQFLQTGKPVYLQSEYLSTYSTNQAFASIISSLGGSFSWTSAFSGDLIPMNILGTYATTNNTVATLPDFWYSYSGTGDCNTINMLEYGGGYHGFQYIPVNPAHGTIMTTADQDWIRTFSSQAALLMENLITHLINPPASQAGIQVNLGNDTTLCYGNSLLLDATSPGATYLWHDNSTNPTFQVTLPGTYWVVVDDVGCVGVDTIHIDFHPQDLVNLGNDTILCQGNNLSLDASYPGATYLWSDMSTNSNLTVTSSGTYWVEITVDGCYDTDTIQVSIVPNPVVDLGSDINMCDGEVAILDAGTGFSHYQWNPSGNTQTIDVTTGGTYSVTVTDNYGCQGSDSILVTFIDNFDATILTTGPFCENDAPEQFTATDGGGMWSGNGISSTGLFNPSNAGTGSHIITYSISDLCGDTATQTIVVNEVPLAVTSHTDETCIGAADGTAQLDISGGTSPYIIVWSIGGSSVSLLNLDPGEYSYTISDQNNCTTAGSIIILSGIDDCSTPHVWVPNVFSPNGDGENDILFVRGEGISHMEFIIFNRWGQKMYESSNSTNGWDGTFKGKACPDGSYSYVLKVKFTNNTETVKSGNITLVR